MTTARCGSTVHGMVVRRLASSWWVLSLVGACASPTEGVMPWAGGSSGDVADDGSDGGDGDDDGDDDGDADDDDAADGDGGSGDDASPEDDGDGGSDDGAPPDPDGDGDDGGEPTTPAGTCGMAGAVGEIVQVTLDSPERWYYVGAPQSLEPLPLVVAFHGDEGHPDEAVTWFWTPVWEAHQDFIVVMAKCPGCESWYTGDQAAKTAYVWDVLEDVAARYHVDVSRMYAIGYSGGSSFLAMHGLEFQEVFAGIQWHCGGGWTDYVAPPTDACKVDGRFVIATDDFLWDNAKAMEALLLQHGHEVEFVQAACSGHCCHTDDLAEGAWAWFSQRTKCDGLVTGECAALTDLP